MEINNINNSPKLPLQIDAWKLIEGNSAELIEIHLEGNGTIEKHVNPNDVFFYVLEGNGLCRIGEDSFLLNQGDCIKIDKNLEREWVNETQNLLSLLVFKIIE